MASVQNLDQRAAKRQRKSAKENADSSSDITKTNAVHRKVQELCGVQRFSDITLVVGGSSYPAHRLILSVSSDVFKTMLMSSNEQHQEIIELQNIPQLCIDAFPIFLQYFYTGDVKFEKENIMPVSLLAEKYDVKELTVMCVEYMYKRIVDAADQGQLVSWFQFVVSLNHPSEVDDSYYSKIWQNNGHVNIKKSWSKLFEACRNYIKWNLDLCVKCFNTLDCDVLVGLLKQSDLCVQDEMQLFRFVVSWLDHQSAEKLIECNNVDVVKDYMRSLTEHVMSYIRYVMIHPWQIAQMLTIPVVKQNKDFFGIKMAAAMEYHKVKIEEPSSPVCYKLDCFPRLYTSKRWGKSFKTVYQLIRQDFVTRSCLFDRVMEHEMLHWELEFVKTFCDGSKKQKVELIKTMRAKIEPKLLQNKIKVPHLVRVTILLYAINNEIPHVVTIMQSTVSFEAERIFISGPIAYGVVDELNEDEDLRSQIPFKFHVIITPFVPGVKKNDYGITIEHVFSHS